MKRLLRRLARSATTILATVILLLIIIPVIVFGTGSLSGGEGSLLSGPPRPSDADDAALRFGMPRDEVEHWVGKGQDALAYEETGIASEPIQAECPVPPAHRVHPQRRPARRPRRQARLEAPLIPPPVRPSSQRSVLTPSHGHRSSFPRARL